MDILLTPQWFSEALQTQMTHHSVTVLDASIHYQTWPAEAQGRGLLFVHGHAAHAHWWDFIAPAYRHRFNTGAIDLSGSGDSEHRPSYRASQYAEEIVCIAEQLGPDTIIVAHSFGGSMARIAAHLHPQRIGGLILIDSVITDKRRDTQTPDAVTPPRVRHYASRDEAARRFRLRPPQPRPAGYILDHIAAHSVSEDGNGFHFKLDPQVFDKFWPDDTPFPDAASMVRTMRVPVAYIGGALSRFQSPEGLKLLESLFPPEQLRMIDGAYHHVFLDQPLTFMAQLDELLDWIQAEG